MKVIFLRNYQVKDDEGRTYLKGETVELSQASADHFINRGAAEAAPTGKATKAEKAEKVATNAT